MSTLEENANNLAHIYANCELCNRKCGANHCSLYRLIRAAYLTGYNDSIKQFKR